MITLSWMLLLALVGGVAALVDGILRVRGKGGTVLGIVEIVASALFLLSLFVPGIPFGSLVLAVVTVIVLIVGLFLRGKSSFALTVVALVLLAAWIVLANRWVIIPGLN